MSLIHSTTVATKVHVAGVHPCVTVACHSTGILHSGLGVDAFSCVELTTGDCHTP